MRLAVHVLFLSFLALAVGCASCGSNSCCDSSGCGSVCGDMSCCQSVCCDGCVVYDGPSVSQPMPIVAPTNSATPATPLTGPNLVKPDTKSQAENSTPKTPNVNSIIAKPEATDPGGSTKPVKNQLPNFLPDDV